MKGFYELAQQRRSHRKFTDEAIREDSLHRIMEVALMAPTSKGLHSYSFSVVKDKEQLSQLANCKAMGSQFVADAMCAIVVMADPAVSDVWIEDASTAAMSILYQAEEMGLGACWVQVRSRQDANGENSEDVVRKILSLPEGLRVVCLIPLGHKGMERKPQNMEKIQALVKDKVAGL